MDLQKFDSTLKSALDNIEVPYDPDTWDAMAKRLDTLPAPDAIDNAMRPTLERIETPYAPQSWTALAQRMDGIARSRRLRATKLAEAVLILLLLLNLKGFWSVMNNNVKGFPPQPDQPKTAETIAHSGWDKPKNEIEKILEHTEPVNKATYQRLAEQASKLISNIAAALDPGFENDNEQASVATTGLTRTHDALSNNENALFQASSQNQFPVNQILPGNPVAPLSLSQAPVFIPRQDLPNNTFANKKNRFYAALFGSFDKNYMRDGESADKKNGYGAGFAVGYRNGNWGWEAGLTYAEKNYKPQRVTVEYENNPFTGISLYYTDMVDASVASLPVKVTRQVAKKGKTSTYAVLGLTANFAVSKRYGYKTLHFDPPMPAPNPNQPSQAIFPEGKGLLENGGLSKNAYATADLGIRVERSLRYPYTAFVEPVYQLSLGGGLGPHTARINTFSLKAGVIASL